MHSISRLIKYHLIFFTAFMLLVLCTFYITEGGDLDTPGLLVTYYLISACLSYTPLLLILTVLNFIILAFGFKVFTGTVQRGIIIFLPILIFSVWYSFSPQQTDIKQYGLSSFQFWIILSIWTTLILIGTVRFSGMKQLLPLALLPGILFILWFLLQRFQFVPSILMLTPFQYKSILVIWTFMNCSMLMRYKSRKLPPKQPFMFLNK